MIPIITYLISCHNVFTNTFKHERMKNNTQTLIKGNS
jgi:hypothetical protein